MLFTVLPVGYMRETPPRINATEALVLVWLTRDTAEIAAIDMPLEVWGVMASWETDTFELNRDTFPESAAKGLRHSSLLIRL